MSKIIFPRFNLFLFYLILNKLSFCSFENDFYLYQDNQQSAVVFIDLLPQNYLNNKDGSQIFSQAAFELPQVLEYCKENNLKFILVIPEVLEHVYQLNDNAPWLEGARVALAWASAYFRFNKLGNIDARIVQIKNNTQKSVELAEENIVAAIQDLLSKKIVDSCKTPEENIQKRIFEFDNLNFINTKINKYSLELISFEPEKFKTKIIDAKLPELEKNKKRYVIAGAAGFLGSHLSRALLRDGHQVIGLDNLSCCSGENIQDLLESKNFYFEKFDVAQSFDVIGDIDSVLHFASVPSPASYYNLPIETLQSGLHATRETLELAVRKKAQYVMASTSETYGDPEVNPQFETYWGRVSPIGKRSQYDMSKRGAETLIKLYYDKYKLDVRIARIFNTYGPGMDLNDGRVVTNFIKAVLQNKPMEVYGDGKQTRSFAYVSDLIDGMLKLISCEDIAKKIDIQDRVFNLGNPEEFTIYELAHCLNDLVQTFSSKPASIIEIPQFDPTDPKMRRPDITKAAQILGFNPKIKLQEGLEKTFSFFADNFNKKI